MRKLALKNSGNHAIIDLQVYQKLSQDPHLSSIRFFTNLREHSSGCAVFQKTYKSTSSKSGYRTETIYLHKLIAERFLADQKVGKKRLVGAKNGNKLDCRIANLEYRTRAVASRQRKSSSKAGYTGVYQEGNRFRAVISLNRRSIHLGMFATPEEAALAYNQKSRELFGPAGKVNVILPHASSGESTHGQQPNHHPARCVPQKPSTDKAPRQHKRE